MVLDLKVEPNLDAMLFGESVINDAVAIVLSEVSFRDLLYLGFSRDFSISQVIITHMLHMFN